MAIAVNFKQRNLWLGAGLIGLLAIIATVLLVVLASARPSQTMPFRGTHQQG